MGYFGAGVLVRHDVVSTLSVKCLVIFILDNDVRYIETSNYVTPYISC